MVSPVRSLEIIVLLDLLAAGLIIPQLPPQARSLGCNYILVGILIAITPALQFFSSPITGKLSETKGQLESLLVSLCLSGLAYTLLGVTNSILLFFILQTVLGITKHTQFLTRTLVPDFVKEKNELPVISERLRTLAHVGICVGPIIGGHIVGNFPEQGFTIIAFLVGAIYAINSGLVRKLPKVEKAEKKKDKQEPLITQIAINSVKTTYNQCKEQFQKIDWNKYGEALFFKIVRCICVGVFMSNYVLFLKIKFSSSSITTGYIVSLFSCISFFTNYFSNHINKYYDNDKDFSKRNLHIFSLLTLSLIGVALAPDVSIYVAFLIPLSVASSLTNLITQEAIINKADKSQSDVVLGVANNIRALADVISPLIVGFTAQFVGVLYVVYVAIFLAAFGTYKSYVNSTMSISSKTKKN